MIRPPAIHIRPRNDSGELVTLGRKMWSEVMHQLDHRSDTFTEMLALGLPHWDEDLEDMPAFDLDLDPAETQAVS